MFLLPNRVRDTAQPITGTGSYTLSGSPPAGSRSFAVGLGDGNQTTYVAYDPTSGVWEENAGTYTDATKGLSRDIFIDSSTGSPISWTGQSPQIFVAKSGRTLIQRMQMRSGRWFSPRAGWGSNYLAGGILLAIPFPVPEACTIASIAVVTGGNANGSGLSANLGIYDDAGNIPGNLIAAAPTIAVPTTTWTVCSAALSQTLKGGWVWLAVLLSGATWLAMYIGTGGYGFSDFPFDMGMSNPLGTSDKPPDMCYQSTSTTSFGALPTQFSTSAPTPTSGVSMPAISVQAE